MKAVVYYEYGGPEVLKFDEVPVPEVGENEVLVQVAGSGFNQGDATIRNGYLVDYMPPVIFPFIPNCEASGVVVKVGEGVERLKVGDRVYGYLDYLRNGAAAEYVVSKEKHLALAPTAISLQDAGACAASGCTAWQALFTCGKLEKGQRALILGCGGAVGTFAVQFAKWKGAYVIGVDIKETFSMLEDLGVDEMYDFRDTDIRDVLKEKVDVVFDLTPHTADQMEELYPLVNEGGHFVAALNAPDSDKAKTYGVIAERLWSEGKYEDLDQIAATINERKVKPIISERVPLENLVELHKRAGGTHGKLLMVVNEDL